MTDYTLRLVVDGDASGATSALNSATSALNSFGGNAMKAGGILSAGLTLPLVAIGKAALDAGTKLNAGMANIGSMGIAIGRVNELKKSIQEVSIQTGKTTDDLAKGTYQIISAYGDSASTAKILEVNTKVAAAGVASLSDTVGAISIVTKNWGDTSVEAQQHVGDLLLKTVALGQTTLPELASNLGNVAPAAHAAGISTTEMFASIATAAGVTGNTSAAITQMNGVIAAFSKPSEDMSKLLKAQGFASGEAAIKALGFEGAMQMVYNAHVKTGTALASYTKRIEGARLIQALATTSAKTYGENLKALGNSAGTTDMAFDAQTNGANKAGFAMEVAKAKMEVFLQKIGDAMGPALLSFTDLVGPLVDKLMGLADTFTALDPGTQKWIVGIAAGAAAIGPLLLGVGSLAKTVAFFLPFAAGLATALIPATIGLGLLYAAYKLNAFGLRDLVDTGFKRIQAAAPLAGDAVKSLWKQFTGSREDIGKSTLAIYDFVSTLTGSDAAGLAAVNWTEKLANKIQDVKKAFNDAGGGQEGFLASLKVITGVDLSKYIKVDTSSKQILKVGDWFQWDETKLALKIGDHFSIDPTAIKLHFGDFFNLDTTLGKEKLQIGDWYEWDNAAGKMVLKIGDYFTWDNSTGKQKLKFGDFYEWDSATGKIVLKVGDYYTLDSGTMTKLKFGDWYSFESTGEKTKISIGDWYELDQTKEKTKLKLGDWYELDNMTMTKLKFGDWYSFDTTAEKTKIKIGDWYELDQTAAATKIKMGDLFTLDSTAAKTKITIGDVFEFDTGKPFSLNPATYIKITDKYTLADVFSFSFTGMKLTFEKLNMADLFGGSLTWPTLPTWTWPAYNAWTWADYKAWTWPAYLTFTWPAYLTWTWPDIPTPTWLTSLLNWSPSISIPTIPGLSSFLGGGGGSDFKSSGSIGKNASGTDNWQGGWTWVGENGPELLNLPGSSKIVSNNNSKKMIGHMAGGNYDVPYSPIPYTGPYAPQPFINNPFGTQAGPSFDEMLGPLNRLTSVVAPKIVENTAATHKAIVSDTARAVHAQANNGWTAIRGATEAARMRAAALNPPTDATEADRRRRAAGGSATMSFGDMQKIGKDIAKSFHGTIEEFKSILQKVPGLFGTSSVTSEDMAAAKNGTYQPKADEKLRQLKDLAEHGVQYAGLNVQDFKDALGRIGVKASDDLKTLTAQVTAAWNDQSLFADKKNISSLIDIKAVKASITQQKLQADQSAAGNANLMALFGITPEATKATGKKARQDLQAGLMDASIVGSGATGTGAAGGGSNIVSSLLGNATVTPESVAPFAQSFMAALGKAMTPTKDKNGKSTGIDFGALFATAINDSLATTTALDATGAAILAKIVGTFKDIKGVDFIGGIVGAMNTNLADNSAIKALNNVGQKIGYILKQGIADFFKSVDLASAVANGAQPATTATGTSPLPGNASGTNFWRGGYTRMDERGGEIVDLPRGSRIFPRDLSVAMANAGGGEHYTINNYNTIHTPIDEEKLLYRMMSRLQKRGRG